MLKFEIRNIIVTYLVYENFLGEYPLDLSKTFGVDTVKREIEIQKKIRLKQIAIEEMQEKNQNK